MENRRFESEADVRTALRRRLGRPVRDDIWELLVEDYYVGEVLKNEFPDAFDSLFRQYRRLNRLGSERMRRSRPMVGEAPPDKRWQLISKILAEDAQEYPLVRRFRREHLQERLLEPQEVEAWIEDSAQEDGPPTRWLTLPCPPKHTLTTRPDGSVVVEPPLFVKELSHGLKEEVRLLSWVGGQGWVRRKAVAAAGVLNTLHELAVHLARRYGWHEAKCTTFVLTGQVPVLSPIRYRVSYHGGSVYERARIRLEVDPGVSPDRLVDVYRKVRRGVSPRRRRPLSPKIADLVSFILGHPAGSWEARRKIWNEEHPDWRYDHRRSFSRDFHRAVASLFRPPSWEPAQK